jgi:acylpyruvate hydrolase
VNSFQEVQRLHYLAQFHQLRINIPCNIWIFLEFDIDVTGMVIYSERNSTNGTKGDAMRFATIRTSRGLRLHVKGADGYVDVADASGNEALSTINGLAEGGDAALESARAASSQSGTNFEKADFAGVTPNPPRVLCLGVNYADHAIEGGREVPTWPESFVRGAGSVIGAYDDMVKPHLSERFDYEGELAIVIGKGGRYIPADKALDAILGYAVMNDGSAREWQRAATQWTPGKNFEGTMPIGPEVVTPDEVDITDLAITTTLNGTVMQDARTSDMIVSVAKAVEYFSSWLTPGDIIEVTVEGIGTITNKIVAEVGAPQNWPWMPLKADTKSF